jgi:hypothetical protein
MKLPRMPKCGYDYDFLREVRRAVARLTSSNVDSIVFGGFAVSCYLGFLHRNLKDIDMLLINSHGKRTVNQMSQALCLDLGYNFRVAQKKTHLNFKTQDDPIVELHIVRDTLKIIDVRKRVVCELPFEGVQERSTLKTIGTLSGEVSFAVRVLGPEDLFITEILPPPDPQKIFDMHCLCKVAEKLDFEYISMRLETSPRVKSLVQRRVSQYIMSAKRIGEKHVLIEPTNLLESLQTLKRKASRS